MDVELNKIVWKQFFINWSLNFNVSLFFYLVLPALKRIWFVSKLCPLDLAWFIANWCIRGSNYVTIKAWFIGPLYRQRYVHFQTNALPLRSRGFVSPSEAIWRVSDTFKIDFSVSEASCRGSKCTNFIVRLRFCFCYALIFSRPRIWIVFKLNCSKVKGRKHIGKENGIFSPQDNSECSWSRVCVTYVRT